MKKGKTIDFRKFGKDWVALSKKDRQVIANNIQFKIAKDEAIKKGEKRPVMVKASALSNLSIGTFL